MSRYPFGSATLLAYKTGIGTALSMIAATATVIIFQSFFELSWFISIPAAVLAYLTMPVLWSRYINSLEQKKPR
jgi:cytosine/uracil/thiamine/allantoin permease